MAKRIADKELTDRNWDQEDELEEAGQFHQASRDDISKRVIRKAKRRVLSSDGAGSTAGAFAGFAGFSKAGPLGGQTPSFSFGSAAAKTAADSSANKPAMGSLFTASTQINKSSQDSPSISFGVRTSPATESKPTSSLFSFVSTASTKAAPIVSDKSARNGVSVTPAKVSARATDDGAQSSKHRDHAYYQALRSLNESVLTWIRQHVETNPYIILAPIFVDYDKYVRDLDDKYPSSSVEDETDGASKADGGTSGFNRASFGSGARSLTSAPPGDRNHNYEDKPAKSAGLQFGSAEKTPGFSFGSGSTFGQKPFSFAGQTKNAQTEKKESEDEEEQAPPRPDFKEVMEEDAFYTKRCKLFYKGKDGKFIEKGVGNLHLKPSNEKTQVVIRADTSLGNILFNIILTSSMPVSRIGKNNVALVCIPNPPADPKDDPSQTVMMLIRVKTSEEADDLLKKLEECKG
ncbi:PREDICTED: nuclear pore complex protein Nup50-like [Priapulus caudatus]|uniref:Nuclear pore complex protein Nup50-like n=1 Tax=Priapulus caudatus TaxID=37621 RepID=A0ABM1DWD4_PRICU|nr:PREDICTED: nuclear pore complex protein Nup50-like [Priapulus caudatus]XP_014664257.1 PREDICTED: nuclear pore complex protein Nup50-like [Priapulus caudatus]